MRRFVLALLVLTLPACRSMTFDQKVGQLFSYAAHGVFMNEQSDAYQQLLRQVRDNHVGGVIWFVSSLYDRCSLASEHQELLVGIVYRELSGN